jgi:hypothetical protein
MDKYEKGLFGMYAGFIMDMVKWQEFGGGGNPHAMHNLENEIL